MTRINEGQTGVANAPSQPVQKESSFNKYAKAATLIVGVSAVALAAFAAYNHFTSGSPQLEPLGTLESLRAEFGEGRTLNLVEAGEENSGLYAQVLNSIPKRLGKQFFGFYNKEDALRACEFRKVARDYTQERTWWIAEKWTDLLEVLGGRGKSCEAYYDNYQDATKVVEKSMTPNPAYHNEAYLKSTESWLNFFSLGTGNSLPITAEVGTIAGAIVALGVKALSYACGFSRAHTASV